MAVLFLYLERKIMNDDINPIYSIPLEIILPGGTPLIADLGLIFVPFPVDIENKIYGLAPTITYFNDLITGEGYTAEYATHVLDEETLVGAIKSLAWSAHHDDEGYDDDDRDILSFIMMQYQDPSDSDKF